MINEKFLNEIRQHGLDIKQNDFGKAVYYSGIPLPHTVNKSDEYMKAYIEGFIGCMLICKGDRNRRT